MSEYLEIGSTPYDEECVQVGADDYREQSIKECRAYANQLKRMFPNGRFSVKSFPHDYGSYREVVAYMDTEEETDAAFEAEGNGPANWDEEALIELNSKQGQQKSRVNALIDDYMSGELNDDDDLDGLL